MNPKEYLIVIDMQKDFIDGSLANEDAKAIIGAVIVEIREWKGYVFYTMDTHGADFKQTLEGVLPEHCIKGTEGWKFEESIQQALDDAYATRIEKPTFGYLGWAKYFLGDDAFNADGSLKSQEELAKLGKERIKRIRLVGTCTDICVISNAMILRAMFKDTPIEIVEYACAATPGAQAAAILVMERCGFTIIRKAAA